MVKVADLGYVSKNLQDIPSKSKQKELRMHRALSNLTSTSPPERLTRTSLPDRLMNLLGE